MDLENLCHNVRVLAEETGDYIAREQKRIGAHGIESKGLHNYVTHVDTSAEEMIIRRLRELLPGSGFIAEEGTTARRTERYNWIIDPLDGTTNYIHNLPPYAVSIALSREEQIILGVVYEITSRECFYAWEGSDAFLNGKQVSPSNIPSVSQSLIATGFPYTNFEHIGPYLQSFKYFLRHSHGLRRLGSAATDIAYIACGRFDAFYEYGLHSWDVAAACMILRQAGGRIGDFSGGDNWLHGGKIVAANPCIYEEFLEIINQIMVQEKTLI